MAKILGKFFLLICVLVVVSVIYFPQRIEQSIFLFLFLVGTFCQIMEVIGIKKKHKKQDAWMDYFGFTLILMMIGIFSYLISEVPRAFILFSTLTGYMMLLTIQCMTLGSFRWFHAAIILTFTQTIWETIYMLGWVNTEPIIHIFT